MDGDRHDDSRTGRRIRRTGIAAFAGAALLGTALAAPPAGAQEPETPPDTIPRAVPDSVRYELRGLTVEATRPTLTGGGATAIQMTMDSVEVVPAPTLDEVLRTMPLVRVRRNSRGQVQPSVRGMEERQIAVLVDGVPLTIGWDNRSDLSVIPMTAANEINMVRGLSSVLAGPNALGGVIKIGISQGPFPDTVASPFDLRAAVSHTGAYSLSGTVDHLVDTGGGRLWIKYGGGYRDRDSYAAPSGLESLFPAGVVDDRILNSDMRHANGFASVRYQGGGGEWLSLSTAGYTTEQGVVPELHLLGSDQPAPRFWRYPNQWQSFSSLSAGTGWRRTPLGEGDLEASVGLDFRHMEIDGFSGPSYADSVEGEIGDDRTVSLRLLGDHTLGPGTLSGSFTWAETWHEQTLSTAPGDPEEFVQRLGSVGLETSQPLLPGDDGGWIADPRITLGASYDWSSTPETGEAEPRPGIDGWGLRASSEVTVANGAAKVHGGVSRKVRFPALRELYSGALGKFEPNPDLGPLTLKVGEIGATVHAGRRLEVQGTLFQQQLEGSIARVPIGDGLFQRQNVGERRATGVELVANYRRSGLVLRGGLTLQDVELREDVDDDGDLEISPDKRAEYQPEVSGDLSVRTPEFAGFRLRGEMQYIGSQFGANPQTGDFEELDPTAYLEAGVSRRIGGGFAGLPPLRVSAVAENLTDQLVWDQLGLPRPGRTFRVQVELR